MHVHRRHGLPLASVLVAALGLAAGPAGRAAASAVSPAATHAAPASCAAPAKGRITCAAIVAGHGAASAAEPRAAATAPPGLGAADLQSAYGLSSASGTGGAGQTVAVVTAWDDPTAESDLASYRSQYSLPACTTASGCFSKVDENGGTAYPPTSAGWPAADAQAMDMISAICPNCHILLVEASNSDITDEGTAENEAVTLGAKFITNTWFTQEATFGTSEPSYDTSYFTHPGVVITAPDGAGSGFGTYYPAASPGVLAVGGTTLTKDTAASRGWDETTWSDTGSGCSPYEAKPTWQADTGCAGRMLNDAAAVADPASQVEFFDTASGGWSPGGGNNISSAIIAAWFALGGGVPDTSSTAGAYLYANASTLLNDITAGSNGTCAVAYLCTAGTGYDGPSGEGSPAGPFGSPAPAASTLPGAPVIHNPGRDSMDIYARASASLDTDFWNGTTWSGWSGKGGSIASRPAAVYNPTSKNLEVYARSSTNTLEEDYWNATNGWSGWKDLGGSIGGTPAAVYDPANGNLEVYARNGSALDEIFWSKSGGWSAWKSLGGNIGGNPSAVWDPAGGALEVYAHSNSDTLWEAYWRPKKGWSSQDLGGGITGSPAAVWDPAGNALEVYATTGASTLWEAYWRSGKGWQRQDLGGSVTGTPSPVANPVNGDLEVYAQGTGKTLQQIFWHTGTGWSAWASLATGINTAPAAIYNPGNGDIEVYAAGSDGAMRQEVWRPGTGWTENNLGGSLTDV